MGTLTATNPLLTRSVSDTLYDYSMSSAFRSAYVYDPSFALARTPDVWEIVRNDVSFSASFERYSNNVTKPWHVEAPKKSKEEADQQYAGIVEDALGQIFDFDTSRWVLSEAAFLARRYAFIESERRSISLDGTTEMDWIIPTFIKDVDRRRFRWVPTFNDKAVRTGTKLSFWNSIVNQWQDVAPEFRSALIEYLWYNTEDRVGYSRGWLEPIYFAHYMKTNAIQKVADGIDRWAKGIWLVKLDGLRNSSIDKTNEALLAGAKTMIQTMRSDNIGVIENVDDIQVIESTGTGHEMGLSFADYWDNGVERLVNGSTRPAGLGGQKTGARAQSETEEDTSEAHYQPARDRIDAVINRDLVGWFISQPLNRQNLLKLGLEKAKRPVYHTRQEKKLTIPDVIASASMFLDRGMPLVEGEVYERCGGWGVPSKTDKQITGKMPMGQGDMIGDFGKAEEINSKADQNAVADRKAKQKTQKMEEDIVAKFDELRDEINSKTASERENGNIIRLESEISELRSALFNAVKDKPQPVIQAPQPIMITANIESADRQLDAQAKRDEILFQAQEKIAKFMQGVLGEIEMLRQTNPAPIVNVVNQVPQAAPPVIHNIMPELPAPTVINNIEPSKVVIQEAAKQDQHKHVEIKRDGDGKITGAEITVK